MSDYEPLHDQDTGEVTGYSFRGVDGTTYAADLEGQVVAYLDEDGDAIEVEPGALYVDDPAFYEPDPVVALEQRMAAAEETLAQPREPTILVPEADIDHLDPERVTADWARDAGDIERGFDRRLTDAERRRLATHAAHESYTNLIDAAEDLAQRGHGLTDLDDPALSANQRRERRQAYAAERYADLTGESGDPVTGERAPRGDGNYNLDTHQGRVDLALDRIEGRVPYDALIYDSADEAGWAEPTGDDGLDYLNE